MLFTLTITLKYRTTSILTEGVNEVPQNELTKMALLEAAFEEALLVQNGVEQVNSETFSEQGDSDYIYEVMDGHLIEMEGIIGNIFNEPLFSDMSWATNSNNEVTFSGKYAGQIVEGEPSHLEFVFEEIDFALYSIKSQKYNGDEVTDDGFFYILNLIENASY